MPSSLYHVHEGLIRCPTCGQTRNIPPTMCPSAMHKSKCNGAALQITHLHADPEDPTAPAARVQFVLASHRS